MANDQMMQNLLESSMGSSALPPEDPQVANHEQNMKYMKEDLYRYMSDCQNGDESACLMAETTSQEMALREQEWERSPGNPKNQKTREYNIAGFGTIGG